jgi:phosphoribosyl-ATP pyrophosphohydrolase
MSDLMSVIAERKANPQSETSYVARLMSGGIPRIGAKILEEAAEVVEAGEEPRDAGRQHLVKEVADLVFHSLVLLGYRDLHWNDVEAELGRRFGVSGIVEKAARTPPGA